MGCAGVWVYAGAQVLLDARVALRVNPWHPAKGSKREEMGLNAEGAKVTQRAQRRGEGGGWHDCVLSQVVDPLDCDDGGDGEEHVHDEYRAQKLLHLRARDLASFPECEHDLE